ncbi:MAG: SusC/RagA family TonB-linked outer membrane protein [Chitinophagaceae bacterium]
MKQKILITILFTLSCILQTFAQQKTVTGTVTDKSGVGVAGVSVLAKGSRSGTQTNSDGAYSLSVSDNAATLVFTSVGYGVQEVTINGRSAVDVTLETTSQDLNAVVVIGYGTARKRDVTGAVSSIKAKDFNQGLITAPDQLLQGKVSGLEITSNSGQPGAATTIKIRGNNSIRANNNPLYVIDGVPLDGRTARPNLVFGGTGLDFGTTPESNPLLYINPNDIAQIDILKDASAAAIYGSRGANGIIVITTKKGGTGTKIEFGTSFSTAAGFMKKVKILSADEFRSLTKANSLNFDSSSSVDALKEITQNKISQNYSLALSGGNESGKFRVSFLGSRTNGFIKKTSLDKYLGNFSGQYKFIDNRLSLDFNLIAGHTTEHMGLFSNTAGAGGNLMSYALQWNPTKSFRTSNGLYSKASNSIPNPLGVIEGYNDAADVNVFLGNISAGVKLIKGLDYKFLYAINHGTGNRNTNFDGWVDGIQGISGSGFAAISKAAITSQTFTHTLNYTTQLTQNIRFEALAGYEYWKTDFSNSTITAAQFNTNLDQANRIPILYTSFFQNASTQKPLNTSVDPTTEIQSYFGRVNFNMQDKYYLTATVRADGSSKFGANNKYGYFPSVGAKWVVSNEDFMKSGTIFTNLALRGSWGITGNQEFPSGASLEQFNSGSYNSIGQSNVANPDLKWERTTQVNVGLDYSVMKGRIFGSLDYYHKNTTDLLFQDRSIAPAPASVYYINLPANLINQGVEFSIGANIISKKQFDWDAGFNIAYNKNKLTNFSRSIITALVSGQGVSNAFAQNISNDQPVNAYFLKVFSGFDTNGQQIISDNPAFVGDPNPHVIFGFSNTLRFNKLSFTLNASGATGFLIYNNTYNTVTNISNISQGKNIDASAIGSKENLKASVAASSRYLEKGDYIKLRNASFSYAFGNMGKYVKNLNVFVSGTNLFVITKFTGFDPEVNIDKSSNNYPSRSIAYIPYPTPRLITFGFNLSL